MNATEIIKLFNEEAWYKFKETVTLYHGTSSVLVGKIKKEGLRPPPKKEEIKDWIRKIVEETIKRYTSEYKQSLVDRIVKYAYNKEIEGHRGDVRGAQVLEAVYLSTGFEEAKGYAKNNVKFGGEIAMEIAWATHIFMDKWGIINKKEWDAARMKGPEELANAYPVVLEVEVPFEWMKTWRSTKEIYHFIVQAWHMDKKRYPKFQDYLDKEALDPWHGFEVRVTQTIPPEMIKKVTRV